MSRLFVGFPISQHLINEEKDLIDAIVDTFPDLRLVPSSNLHITLVPPWNETNISKAIDSVRSFIKESGEVRGEISFHKIDFGPTSKLKRLIWMEGVADLGIEEFREKMENYFDHEPRQKWTPHITLGRFQKPDSKRESELLPENIHLAFKPTEVVLYESHLKSSGAEYEKLARFKLNR